jgi:hypothetical protein
MTILNFCTVFLEMSKSTEGKALLTDIEMSQAVSALSRSANQDIVSLSSKIMSNLSSSDQGSIEAGAVSALISMSLTSLTSDSMSLSEQRAFDRDHTNTSDEDFAFLSYESLRGLLSFEDYLSFVSSQKRKRALSEGKDKNDHANASYEDDSYSFDGFEEEEEEENEKETGNGLTAAREPFSLSKSLSLVVEFTSPPFVKQIGGKSQIVIEPPLPPPIDSQSLTNSGKDEESVGKKENPSQFYDTTDMSKGKANMALAKLSIPENMRIYVQVNEEELDISSISFGQSDKEEQNEEEEDKEKKKNQKKSGENKEARREERKDEAPLLLTSLSSSSVPSAAEEKDPQDILMASRTLEPLEKKTEKKSKKKATKKKKKKGGKKKKDLPNMSSTQSPIVHDSKKEAGFPLNRTSDKASSMGLYSM